MELLYVCTVITSFTLQLLISFTVSYPVTPGDH